MKDLLLLHKELKSLFSLDKKESSSRRVSIEVIDVIIFRYLNRKCQSANDQLTQQSQNSKSGSAE